jgi:two-component system, LuxR family, response regulator FixJ
MQSSRGLSRAEAPQSEVIVTVFVVDDDPAMRESLSWLLQSAGLTVETYESAEHFLSGCDPTRAGCLLLDLKLPGRSGLELQHELAARGVSLPIIFLTGYAEVPTAVRALKTGAFDFLEKPFSDETLLDCVRRALNVDKINRQKQEQISAVTLKMARLSPREREVMELMISGKPTKVIASELVLSPKTVEVHRGRVMRKMEVRTLPHLVRQVMETRREKPD